jgi:4-amino-4-deoxy-L-arabinose transferase-like glycosyltransferase
LVALAAGLRVETLSSSLWLDEGFSIASAQHPWGFDKGRPLYFWFLQAWMKLGGDSEVWLRIPSVVFGVGSVALLYLVALRLSTRFTAVVAALLMCLSASQAFHSQEVRMYTLAPFLLLGSAHYFLAWLESRSLPQLLVHCAGAYLALLTFPPVILGLGGMWLFGLWSMRGSKRHTAMLAIAALVTTSAWLPLALVLIEHPEATGWIAKPSVSQFSTIQGWAFVSTGLWQVPLPWQIMNWTSRALSLLVLVLALIGALSSKGRAIGIWYFAVLCAIFALSVLVRPVWTYRYFMPFFPALFFLVGCALDRLRTIFRPAFYALLAILIGSELLASSAAALGSPLEDWRAAAGEVSAQARAADLVVVATPIVDPSNTGVWSYYYRGSARELYWASKRNSTDEWLGKLVELQQDQQGSDARLWVVLRTSEMSAAENEALRLRLADHFAVHSRVFNGVALFCLSRKGTSSSPT